MSFRLHPRPRTLQAFADGEISGEKRRSLMGHLAECERCCTEVQERMAVLECVQDEAGDGAVLNDIQHRLLQKIRDEAVTGDVRRLLGPMASGGASIERQLQVFLGLRAAAHLKATWMY